MHGRDGVRSPSFTLIILPYPRFAASGTTTVINIGSATAGAGGMTVVNAPTVTFANSVTQVGMPQANLTARLLGLGGATADSTNRLSMNTPVDDGSRLAEGCLSRQTALAMTHQLMVSAKKKWRKLDGQDRLPEIIEGIEFRDGSRTNAKPPDQNVTNFRA